MGVICVYLSIYLNLFIQKIGPSSGKNKTEQKNSKFKSQKSKVKKKKYLTTQLVN